MHFIVISKGIVGKRKAKIFTLVFCLSLTLTSLAQTVTLSLKEVSIEKAFSAIESQTPFRFVYSTETIKNAKLVSLEISNASVHEALTRIFSSQPLSFTIEDKQIIVKANDQKPVPLAIGLSGRVLDESGNALQGVNITAMPNGIITVSDENGNFHLPDLKGVEALRFSMVGYQTLELAAAGRSYFSVRMPISVNILDETVVKGYYSTTRRFNTGSVDKVSNEEISRQPVSNVLGALESRVPGLLITQKNGLPGSNFSVLIRGQNSIQNGTSPLYIIDGVPFLNESDQLTQQSGINAGSPLNSIDPSDIESVQVLKDADATAIYGSRGANGVILITTRRTRADKTLLSVNLYQGFSRVTHITPYMNTQQYLVMRHEALQNDGLMADPSNAFDFLVWDSTQFTNLPKLLIGNTASTTNLNLRLSGGSGGTTFTFGTSYNRQTTVFPGNTDDVRKTFDLGLNHSSSRNKFSLSFTTGYSNDKSNLFSLDLTQFINLPPTLPSLYDSAGKLNWSSGGFSFYNPLSVTLQPYNLLTTRLTSNLTLNYNLSSKFSLKSSFGYNELHADENASYPIASQDPAYAPMGAVFFGTSQFKNWIVEPQAEFHTAVGKKGKFLSLIGGSWQENNVQRSAISGSGYTNDKLLGSINAASDVTTKTSDGQYRYNGVFARLNYSFQDKYLVNITGRRDGSSRFGPGRQFANFGALGLGWIFTSEKWVNAHLPFISFGKLRGSYGITGNDLIGDYQYLDSYRFTTYPYQGDPSLIPQKLFNPAYSWEQIRKLDLALEMNFFKNRLNLTVDYFKNRSDNQIINYSLPGQVGFTTVLQNFPGVVQNMGIEVQLGGDVIRLAKLRWHSLFQLTASKNSLAEFPGLATSSYASRFTIGKPLNSYRGYLFAGVDDQTGTYQFFDRSKNKTSSPDLSDYTYLGTTDPRFYGSWNNEWTYSGWSVSVSFEFRKQLGIDPFFGHFEMAGANLNEPQAFLKRWQNPGDQTKFEKFTQGYGIAASAAQNLTNSSAALTDASFIRLKSLYVAYNLSSGPLQKLKMQSIRIYLEGQNLALFTKYKGNDPETQSPFSLPPLRTVASGIQINF